MNKARVKDMLISGLLTGMLTGLSWSFVIELFSTDHVFDGVEMLCSLSVPALVALLVWRMWGVRVWVLLAVAYLTLMIPLFGMGIGGANVLQMILGGTIGGAVWISLFVYCQRIDRRRSETTSHTEQFDKAKKQPSCTRNHEDHHELPIQKR